MRPLLLLFLAGCSMDAPDTRPTAETTPVAPASKKEADTGRSPEGSPGPASSRPKTSAPRPSTAPAAPKLGQGIEKLSERPERLRTRHASDSPGYMPLPDDLDGPMSAEPTRRAPGLSWGGRTFLSNDDSMSLASAQRVLWAVANGQPVDPASMRPHEFLNYFTFPTDPIAEGASFGVTASAVQTDQGLSLALALTGTTPAHRPMDLTLLLDDSGSMDGEGRMVFLQRGLTRMLDELHPGDRVDIVVFDDKVSTPVKGFVVGRDDLDDLRLAIDQLKPHGRTDMDAGLKAAYQLARANGATRPRAQRIVLVTDAQLTAGDIDADRVTEIARACDESGIRLSGVGVGRDFDDHVLQELTEKGKGAYVYLGSEAVVDRIFGTGFDALVGVLAEDMHVALQLPASLAMKRFYGEEASHTAADVQPVNFFVGTTQVFLEDLSVAQTGLVTKDSVALDLSWTDPVTRKPKTWHWSQSVGQLVSSHTSLVKKARALMAWTDLVSAGPSGATCRSAKATWEGRARSFGADVETRYLTGLTKAWCPVQHEGAIAEASE